MNISGDVIREYCAPRSHVSAAEVLQDALQWKFADRERAAQMAVAHVLRDMGWRRARIMLNGRQEWRFVSPSACVRGFV